MRRLAVAALLSAAVAGAGGNWVGAAPAGRERPRPPAAAAEAQARVPVKQVVLFSSGVGYFEHFGSVQGDGSTELRFKTQQINDILKSLILQDLDGGKVTAVTYPSQDPVQKTLRSFQVDIYANPSLADLIGQLRGARVTVTLADKQEKVSGTVLGVERKQRPVPGPQPHAPHGVVEVAYLNLLTGASIRQVSLEAVQNVEIEDPVLRGELEKALAALAAARDQDTKPVSVRFRGEGERRVRVGYVIETPVWKTSYRLILGGGPADAEERKEAAAGAGGDAGGGVMQGWAIVENQTDSDWDGVQLSLVSGRPISFIQDLYQPLYVPRPVVQPELYASLRPQTYDAGIDLALANAPAPPAAPAAGPAAKGAEAQRRRAGRESLARLEEAESAGEMKDAYFKAGLDATASVSSIASAAKVGELFQYTVGSVSLPRQKSAMIPIVTDAVEVERLSIYNQSVLPRNPLNGARVKNTTGKHLLQGPITVLDNGAYAGDARIDDVPPGQERLISYGVDQQVIVNATAVKHESSVLAGKIVKGVLQLTYKDVFAQEYVADNKGDKARTLVIEHPVRQGWKLVKPPKADETTDTLHRFRGAVEPGKATKLAVQQELVRGESVEILPMDIGQLQAYQKTGSISEGVRQALAEAITLKFALVETERQIQERQQKVAEISQEQARIRENMKAVGQGEDYYKRLVKKLGEQETAIEKLQSEAEELREKLVTQRKALEDYLAGLNVG